MSKKLKTILQYSFFLGLGIFLVWWSIKDLSAADTLHIKDAVKNARYGWAIPGFAILLLSHYVRAVRWRLLIEPLGYTPAKSNMFLAVMTGYLANQAVPRLGEVLKCTSLTRYEKIPFEKLFGTVILERIIDTVCLGIIFIITLAIQPDLYAKIMTIFFNPSATTSKPGSIYLYAAVGMLVVIIALFIWMKWSRKSWRDVWLIFKNLALRLWEGLTTILRLKKRGLFILLTIVIWICYALGGYIGFLALQETEHYGIKEMLTVLCAGSIGMIATPGGIGAYPFLLQKTLQLYGLNMGTGLAYGWLMWLMQTIVILVGGLFSLIALPLTNKSETA